MENTTQTQTTTPKAPRSAAQIAASRANGAKSKGPVTPEGKAISSQNAARHGVFAQHCTILGESKESFAQMMGVFYETWAPVDEHECCLVDTMAMAMWRRTRLISLEASGLSHQIAKSGATSVSPSVQYNALTTLAADTRAFELLHRYEKDFTRIFERAARSLMAYRKFRQEFPATPDSVIEQEPDNQPDNQPEPEIQNPQNEPEPHPRRPLNRRERRQLKWQKAHPKATSHRPGTSAPAPKPPTR